MKLMVYGLVVVVIVCFTPAAAFMTLLLLDEFLADSACPQFGWWVAAFPPVLLPLSCPSERDGASCPCCRGGTCTWKVVTGRGKIAETTRNRFILA